MIINIVGGPGTGKSVLAAHTFVKLKIAGHNAEYAQEYAKNLVLTKSFDLLNNQHYVSMQQFKILEELDNSCDVVITDGSLLHSLYYNRFHEHFSDKVKTEEYILEKFHSMNNLVFFLERSGDFAYQQHGRYQNEIEATKIDNELKSILNELKIPFISIPADLESAERILLEVASSTL